MESAKAAVKDFMSKSGQHDTTVHEKVAPAVQHETIERQKHEKYTSAIDKEVHQDHYHTTEQPVLDREVLPEQHHTNIIPVEHRSYEHGNNDQVEARLAKERAAYKDTVDRVEGSTTREINPVIAGEHKHHHVHETIQPVIQKETIEPHVTHTTVPIHEVHHNAAQHHAASALPAVSMAEFKSQGGALTGREERQDGFIGEPKSAHHGHDHSTKESLLSKATGSHTGATGSHTGTTGSHLGSGSHSNNDSLLNKATGTHNTTGTTGTTGSHLGSGGHSNNDSLLNKATGTHNTTGTSGTNDSLLNKATGTHNTTGTTGSSTY